MARPLPSVVLALATLAGCRSSPTAPALGPEGAAVRLADAPPPAPAATLGEVVGQSGEGCGMFGKKGSRQAAEAIVRSRTAALGGDYAAVTKVDVPVQTMDCLANAWVVHAVAYRTADAPPPPPRPAPPPPLPPAAACTPICSPGYACGAGTCVAQCNPACGAGSVCRQDRVCVPAP